jgi:hypothetical protein
MPLLAVPCAALPAFAHTPASGATGAQRKQSAARHIDAAAKAAQTMAADPRLAALLKRARGGCILPRYARAGSTVAIHDIRVNQGPTDAYHGQAPSARHVLEREHHFGQAAPLRKAPGGADTSSSSR